MAKIKLPAGTDLAHLHEIYRLAQLLMEKYGLNDWTLKWDRAHKRAGQCDHENHVISLSAPLMALWTVEQAKETILHEIAHALAPFHGHDDVWRSKCYEVGISPIRCWGRNGEAHVPERYEGTCPNGHKSYRSRKPKARYSCPRCNPQWDSRYIFQWIDTTEE